ncbi:DUF3291 domain-containing protein [Maricaulis sp.]|uniref:DUF3291 domain-containing protein n=1 Tax=Maricaulis sp. TaxID=1486257 RepID=UPI0026247472|nr:DUF3291 domain-containing protein [Maricaulis sp.]
MPKHLAQYNVAKMRGAGDDPVMDDFSAAVPGIHKLAQRSPGFVRLIDDGGYKPWGDEQVLPNLTVWESLEALKTFTYRTAHGEIFSKRDKWFVPLGRPHNVLWWFEDDGTGPDFEDATRRLDHLNEHGPTAQAFSFGVPFDADGQPLAKLTSNRTQAHVD